MTEDGSRAAGMLDLPLSEKDQELISFLKRKFAMKLDEEHSYCAAKVRTKTNTKCVLAREDRLHAAYELKQDTLRKGLFSPINKPYKTVGTLYRDILDLFSVWLSTEDQDKLKMHWDKKYWKKSAFMTSKFAQDKQMKATVLKDEQRQPDPASAKKYTGNGLLELKHYLKEMSSMKHTLNAGRPLIFCLKEHEKQSSVFKAPAKFRCDWPMSAEKETAKPVPMSINQKTLDPKEQESLQRMLCRKKELLAEKLQWIYMVLCGLSHMRNRDLKTTVPLNTRYMNIIMMDPDKTNILLRQSQSSFKMASSACQHLACLVPEDCSPAAPDAWETFVSLNETAENKMTTPRTMGNVSGQAGPWRRPGQRDPEGDVEDVATWLALLLAENSSLEKKTPKPKDHINMLDRFKMEFSDAKNLLNTQMETLVLEKKKNQGERMKTLLNASMTSTNEACLSTLLVSLRSKFKEPKSTTDVWFTLLTREAKEVGGEKYESILQKISYFNNFTNKKVPYSKEKFCLLVLSLPANRLLRPAMQEALLFLTENVLQLHVRNLKEWYHYLSLPFSTPQPPSPARSEGGLARAAQRTDG